MCHHRIGDIDFVRIIRGCQIERNVGRRERKKEKILSELIFFYGKFKNAHFGDISMLLVKK